MQGLCCLDVQGPDALEKIHAFFDDSRETPDTIATAHRRLTETFESRSEIDKLLARHARHWELSRLAMVDRNILRLAATEFRSGDTPFKVVIAEALHLAQEFSTTESPRFINGVLDAIAKELIGETPDATDAEQDTKD